MDNNGSSSNNNNNNNNNNINNRRNSQQGASSSGFQNENRISQRRMSTELSHLGGRNRNSQLKNVERILDDNSKDIFKTLCEENGIIKIIYILRKTKFCEFRISQKYYVYF
jgi:hypothetical protein